ncbi:MAG: GNAT family N-acetyltransferase [Deltaproteobacteria bacterium]|nr:GNAT family N-acetyltransferase [Deltaproteobacteria bacterium]
MIRGATTADYPSFAELFRELGIDDPTPSAERWSSELAHHTLISERAGDVDGYVTFIALSEVGHVRNLVVAARARGTGVGRDLMKAAADRLRARGIGEWHLNVKVDNTPAIRLYERLGMQVEHRSTVLRVDVARFTELPHAPADALPVSPEEDDDIERTLDLLGGRIAMMRGKPGHVLVQLRDPSTFAAVGFAAFDPSLPGAMPFRVARAELAGTMLAELAKHTTNPRIQLVIEDDRATTDLLLRIGGEVRLELLHYRGALPD